jgi:hypothetical protein
MTTMTGLVVWLMWSTLAAVALTIFLTTVPPFKGWAERYIMMPIFARQKKGAWVHDARYWAAEKADRRREASGSPGPAAGGGDDDDDEAPELVPRETVKLSAADFGGRARRLERKRDKRRKNA